MRIITHVQLTKAIFVPNLGGTSGGMEFKRTVSGDRQGYPGIELKLHTNGVNALFKGTEFLIPWNMIECLVLKQDQLEVPSAKKVNKTA